jgi:hypothetical protein
MMMMIMYYDDDDDDDNDGDNDVNLIVSYKLVSVIIQLLLCLHQLASL